MSTALKKKVLTTVASLLFISSCSSAPLSDPANTQAPTQENTTTLLTPDNFSNTVINANTGKKVSCPGIKNYVTYVFNKYGEIDMNVVGITIQTLASQCVDLDMYKQHLEEQKKMQKAKKTFSI